MKLFFTLIGSIMVYLVSTHYGLSSWPVWIILVVLWAIVDYLTYNRPFSWKDYALLVGVLTVVEIAAWNNYFGWL